MYRCTVDNAVTYTSEDFVLFRESPFACWMERLTLENPDHGIPADLGSVPPGDSIQRQDDMADTLRGEGKDVCLIDWEADEASRRSATLDAMRKGADFIVNGQLALGPLSSAANLLMRTSGYSQLGDFLYIPCDTQARNTQHSAFRLCFLADLLHSLQGQMPPQMLIIRGGDDLVPLQTDSYIYHYRAVKQRFMESMRGFRKHRMPDPAASSHFGRWSDCAHEVLKQRMLHEEDGADDTVGEDFAESVQRAVSAAAIGTQEPETLGPALQDTAAPDATRNLIQAEAATANQPGPGIAANFTLAEQARMLTPGAYKPGPGTYRLGPPRNAPASRSAPSAQAYADESGPELNEQLTAELSTESANEVSPGYTARASVGEPASERRSGDGAQDVHDPASPSAPPKHNRRASDAALQNLEFIGSSTMMPGRGLDTAPASELPPATNSAPAPSLRDPRARPAARETLPAAPALNRERESALDGSQPLDAQTHSESWEYLEERSFEAEEPLETAAIAAEEPARPEHVASGATARPDPAADSAIDMDSTYPASPAPGLTTHSSQSPEDLLLEEQVTHGFGQAASGTGLDAAPDSSAKSPAHSATPFSDSIFNNKIFTEGAPDEGRFSSSLITSDDYDS